MDQTVSMGTAVAVTFVVALVSYFYGRMSARRDPAIRQREEEMIAEAAAALPPDASAEVDALLRDGKMIAAVKAVRDATGAQLKIAKGVVDRRRAVR